MTDRKLANRFIESGRCRRWAKRLGRRQAREAGASWLGVLFAPPVEVHPDWVADIIAESRLPNYTAMASESQGMGEEEFGDRMAATMEASGYAQSRAESYGVSLMLILSLISVVIQFMRWLEERRNREGA